jgi:hypothetical protein
VITSPELWEELADARRDGRLAQFDPFDLEEYLNGIHDGCVCPLCDYELGGDE